jgi:transposase
MGLWMRINPLLPPVVLRQPRHPGRERLDPRKVLSGILFVLYTGIRWEFLPQELGFGTGMTCWRRPLDWNKVGVWQTPHELLPAELRAPELLDLSRASVDSSHIQAMKGGLATDPARPRWTVERGKTGSKHHVIVAAHGTPLAAITTGGTHNDVTQLAPLIEAVPPICGKRGRTLCRPRHLHADRGYNHDVYRDGVRRFEITPHIARHGTGQGSGLDIHRRVVVVVKGALTLPHWFHRPRIPGVGV